MRARSSLILSCVHLAIGTLCILPSVRAEVLQGQIEQQETVTTKRSRPVRNFEESADPFSSSDAQNDTQVNAQAADKPLPPSASKKAFSLETELNQNIPEQWAGQSQNPTFG